MEISGYELANLIADAIRENGYTATVWTKKAGETRIYVKNGKKDCGFVRVLDSGKICRELTRLAGTIEAIYSIVTNSFKVLPAPKTPLDQLQQAAERHKNGWSVDSDTVFEAYQSGLLSMSEAMNSDY